MKLLPNDDVKSITVEEVKKTNPVGKVIWGLPAKVVQVERGKS